MDCFHNDLLLQLARGELPSVETAECQAHLAGCADCTARLASAQEAVSSESEPSGTCAIGSQSDTGALSSSGPLVPPPGQLARGDSVGRYLVLDKLGQGGMGEVYAAFDPQLNRKVAVKLLLPVVSGNGGTESLAKARERLLREAQAMAQLSHPNVLPVFDVSEHAGRVFVAMEHVEGQTLRTWMKSEKVRPWREVLRPFLDAGRGLAAAHKAGLIHRDFKPDNVLLSRDGRVYVMDFGLARAESEPLDSGLTSLSSGADVSGDGGMDVATSATASRALPTGVLATTGLLAARLTQHKGVIGTPGYMAPEQIRSDATLDARADIFSFCVSLYSALYGRKPFSGATVRDALQATLLGRVPSPPKSSKVPGWLHRVVLRGLASDRDHRFSSMDALLSALQDDPAVRVRRAVALAVVAASVAAVVLVPRAATARRAAACEAEGRAFADATWTPGRRSALQAAFAATGAPSADQAFRHVAAQLDARAAAWAQQRTDACLATRVRNEASERVLAARTHCLERARTDADALLDVFSQADAKAVERSASAFARMRPLEVCADGDALLAVPAPPQDPAVAARVVALRKAQARANALDQAGKGKDSLDLLQKLVIDARATGYKPVEAEALYALAIAQSNFGNRPAARAAMEAAMMATEAANDDVFKAEVGVLFVRFFSSDPNTANETRFWADYTRALLSHLPRSEGQQSKINMQLGWQLMTQGKSAEAEALLRTAVEQAARAYGRDSVEYVAAANGLASTLTNVGRLEEALAIFEQLDGVIARLLGPEHPSYAINLANIVPVLTGLGQHEDALALAERSHAIAKRTYAENHPNLASSWSTVGSAHFVLGRYVDALAPLAEAEGRWEQAMGPLSTEAAGARAMRANALVLLGRAREALPLAQRAREAAAKAPNNLALQAGTAEALAHAKLALGMRAEATRLLEDAVRRTDAGKKPGGPGGLARVLLARALRESRGDERRAHALLIEARDVLALPGDRWLRRMVQEELDRAMPLSLSLEERQGVRQPARTR